MLDNDKECRICYSSDHSEDLISPCLCKGSMQYVHHQCLDQWRQLSRNPEALTHCGLCRSLYIIPFEKLGKLLTFIHFLICIILLLIAEILIIDSIYNKENIQLIDPASFWLGVRYFLPFNVILAIYTILFDPLYIKIRIDIFSLQ